MSKTCILLKMISVLYIHQFSRPVEMWPVTLCALCIVVHSVPLFQLLRKCHEITLLLSALSLSLNIYIYICIYICICVCVYHTTRYSRTERRIAFCGLLSTDGISENPWAAVAIVFACFISIECLSQHRDQTWIRNYIYVKQWDIITHPCKANDSFIGCYVHRVHIITYPCDNLNVTIFGHYSSKRCHRRKTFPIKPCYSLFPRNKISDNLGMRR